MVIIQTKPPIHICCQSFVKKLQFVPFVKDAASIGGRMLVAHYSSKPSQMEQETLYIKKLSENATTPVRGSPYSAGYDLFR